MERTVSVIRNQIDCACFLTKIMQKVPVTLPFQKTIYQTKNGHSITSDTENLVKLVLKENRESDLKVIDLGTGSGIIIVMIKHYRPSWDCTGIDIQPHLIELARENARQAEVRLRMISADLRDHPFREKYDLVVSNPPYQKLNRGKIPPDRERALSRHEITCTMSDLLMVIDSILNNKGTAYVIYPESRTEEIEKITKNIDLKIHDKFIIAAKKDRSIIFKLERKQKL